MWFINFLQVESLLSWVPGSWIEPIGQTLVLATKCQRILGVRLSLTLYTCMLDGSHLGLSLVSLQLWLALSILSAWHPSVSVASLRLQLSLSTLSLASHCY